MNKTDKVEFSFGWLALKLLGKSLYSNAWSAISELVANGFDAHANEVYVYLDVTNKKDATIEIIDSGDGMSIEDIRVYALVGYNKREALKKEKEEIPQDIMGRKGIGKLAALYLSSHYFICTKKENETQCWEMKYEENKDEHPSLVFTSNLPVIDCINKWNELNHGTLLKMTHVNMSGLGDQAFNALDSKLANYFSLDSMGERSIYLFIKKNSNEEILFSKVTKKIAFKNMAFIEYSPANTDDQNTPLFSVENLKQHIPYTKIKGKYENSISVSKMEISTTMKYSGISKDGKELTKEHSLRGWIGIHCTIDKESGEENDETFIKNSFYNPIQLRLYMRNKLAVENFLTVINSTQTYVNYIEGEINFDLLDDDDFPDIATSNRQGLDEHDDRVLLLINTLKPIIKSLIAKRVELAQRINDQQDEITKERKDSAKQQFTKEVSKELARMPQLTDTEKMNCKLLLLIRFKATCLQRRIILFLFRILDLIKFSQTLYIIFYLNKV